MFFQPSFVDNRIHPPRFLFREHRLWVCAKLVFGVEFIEDKQWWHFPIRSAGTCQHCYLLVVSTAGGWYKLDSWRKWKKNWLIKYQQHFFRILFQLKTLLVAGRFHFLLKSDQTNQPRDTRPFLYRKNILFIRTKLALRNLNKWDGFWSYRVTHIKL